MSEMPPSPETPSPDEEYLKRVMDQADLTDTIVPDAAARMIASQFHGGQTSALYSLASTGAINLREVRRELLPFYVNTEELDETLTKLDHIGLYCMQHGNRGPQAGWSQLWGTP